MLSSADCCFNTRLDLSTAIALLGWLLYIGQICGHIVDCASMVPTIVRVARKAGHFFAKSFYVLAKLVPRPLVERGQRVGTTVATWWRATRPLVEAAQQVGATVATWGRATHCRLASLFRSRVDAGTQTQMTFCRCRGLTIIRNLK